MKKILLALIVIVAILVAFFLHKDKPSQNPIKKMEPTASVVVKPITTKTLSEYIVAYGMIQAQPNSLTSVNLSYDAKIDKMFVFDGEKVKKGQLLFRAFATPLAKAQLLNALNVLNTAKQSLNETKKKFRLHLATTTDVINAESFLKQAQITYSSLESSYLSDIYSPIDGVVTKIYYNEGSNVKAQNSILDIAKSSNLVIKCGVEPEDAAYLKVDQEAEVLLIDYNKNIKGKIISISNAIDPSTHLLNIYIDAPVNGQYLLNSYVQVNIPVIKYTGLSIPKSALLYENGHYYIYVAKHARAYKLMVDVILKNSKYVLIKSKGLKVGDKIIVQGAYELKNGMKIKVIE